MPDYIMAVDAGTTNVKCVLFDKGGNIRYLVKRPLTQYYPQPGWVEHDATEIWTIQKEAMVEIFEQMNITYKDVAAIGITNQRETTVIWDKKTGEPICNAIVWQCKRTSEYCDSLRSKGFSDMIQRKTGLPLDSYFSATKIKWMLDNIPGARKRAENGELLFGTVDTWLIWNLTKGSAHVTDQSNASRTMLFNINDLEWDSELLDLFNIPLCILPSVKPSSFIYGTTELLGGHIPIAGDAGDQQAALFGETCFKTGDLKNTYGTGGFLLMNTGEEPIHSKHGLITTIAWNLGGSTTYALEGSIYYIGSTIEWLRDELGIISDPKETEEMARSVDDTRGCVFVPAFSGLGTPYWDQYARGTIVGLTGGVNKNHIVRAALESMVFQTNDVIQSMVSDFKTDIRSLKVDGGASTNDFVLQTQADITDIEIVRPLCIETTLLGAAYLAGLAVGFWTDFEDILKNWSVDRTFSPDMKPEVKKRMLSDWSRALARSRDWAK